MRGEQPWRTARAQSLRSQASGAERKLWQRLRDRRLGGLKFIRQAPIGTFYVDFLCRERRAIVEVDGGTHDTDAELRADEQRTAALERLGYRLLRVQNAEVYSDINAVAATILAWVGGWPRDDGEDEPD